MKSALQRGCGVGLSILGNGTVLFLVLRAKIGRIWNDGRKVLLLYRPHEPVAGDFFC